MKNIACLHTARVVSSSSTEDSAVHFDSKRQHHTITPCFLAKISAVAVSCVHVSSRKISDTASTAPLRQNHFNIFSFLMYFSISKKNMQAVCVSDVAYTQQLPEGCRQLCPILADPLHTSSMRLWLVGYRGYFGEKPGDIVWSQTGLPLLLTPHELYRDMLYSPVFLFKHMTIIAIRWVEFCPYINSRTATWFR